MKGKIDSGGKLLIERAGGMEPQGCPFAHTRIGDLLGCGDWCPHFGEPSPAMDNPKGAVIYICHSTRLHFDDFTDERTSEK